MKTIFISISNPVTYRNFALFPRSVMHILGEDPNTRIIILLRKGAHEELKERFAGKNYIFEEYTENQKKTFLQKMFYFFYSYLIFTDTTKLVSSYGVRADRPRPFYRFWNYPFKILISRTLGSSRWIKEEIVPKIYLRVFWKRPYKHIFDKYDPDRVFLTSVCVWPADLECLVEARRRGVRSVGMPANWDHLSKYYIPFKPDELLVWSRQVKYEAIKYQDYRDEDVKIVGAPQVDFLVQKENLLPRIEYLKNFGFPAGSKVITFFSQGPYSLDGADIIDMILKWIRAGDLPQYLRVVIRPHPSGYKEIDKYLPFKDDPLVHIDDIEGWSSVPRVKNYLNVLYHSDIVLTTYSSIATEASIFDRPTIIAGFDGYKDRPMYQSVKRHGQFTHFQYLLKFGGIKVTELPREMLDAIKEYLAHPEKDRTLRERLCTEVFGFSDGKNAGRVAGEVLKFL